MNPRFLTQATGQGMTSHEMGKHGKTKVKEKANNLSCEAKAWLSVGSLNCDVKRAEGRQLWKQIQGRAEVVTYKGICLEWSKDYMDMAVDRMEIAQPQREEGEAAGGGGSENVLQLKRQKVTS